VLGQVVEPRLRGAVDAPPVEPARADRGDRLRHVVRRAGRVTVGVREAREPLLLVRLEHLDPDLRKQDEHGQDRSQSDCGEREQVRPAGAGDEQARGNGRHVDE
jgi:hypothetical protein